MPHRQPVPRLWLMTDERMGDTLWSVLRRLPRGTGVVFRHHRLPLAQRRRLFADVALIARRRGLVLVRAGPARLAWREDGVHGQRGPGLVTWPAHNRRQAVAGVRAGATALFVSPIFATRSHPGARPLGTLRAAAIGRGLGVTVIALGGMSPRRFRRLHGLDFAGWAAIDAWS